MKLLHVIAVLGPGGAARSLVTLVKELSRSRPDIRHRVLVLDDGSHVPLLFELRRCGAEVIRTPGPERIAKEVNDADVVLMHFWNAPSLWRAIASHLPPARYVLWLHVRGSHAPQLINKRLLANAARVVATGTLPAELAVVAPDACVVPGLVELDRFVKVVSVPHSGFNADYVGTTNQSKMHPAFIAMLARVDIPELRVRICGGELEPAMQEQVRRSRTPKRFQCLGFVDDVAGLLANSDVFAYPLAEDTYATSDRSLQEAMLAGVPPIVFPNGGPAAMVQDGRTGLVVRSEDEFVAAVEHLHRHAETRARLGANARSYAAQAFLPASHASTMARILEEASGVEPRALFTQIADPQAALLFLLSQDWDEEDARNALEDWRLGRSDRLIRWAEALSDVAFQVEGGIIHWRAEATGDPLIRSWVAGWLERKGRRDEGRAEAAEALRLGAPVRRLDTA